MTYRMHIGQALSKFNRILSSKIRRGIHRVDTCCSIDAKAPVIQKLNVYVI